MNPTTLDPIWAAFQRGDLADAERLCRVALQRNAQDENLLVLLALSLHDQHRPQEAVDVYARLTELFPGSVLHWGNYSTALRGQGRLAEAAQASATALRLAPDDVEQLLNCGLVQLEQRDYSGAHATLLKAYALAPTAPAVRIHAARACSICRDPLVDDLLKPWRSWASLEPDLQLQLATLLRNVGDVNSALMLLEGLHARSPTELPVQLQLADVYERLNRLPEAETLLQRIAREHPGLDAAAQREIQHQQAVLALRSGNPAAARAILEQSGPRNDEDYSHYFVLAEACDKLGDTHATLQAVAIAHARQVEELKRAVPSRFEPDAPILPAAVRRMSAAEYREWPVLTAPDTRHSPVFIVGFPRSGTTLLEQMLDAHPALQSMDERPFFNTLSDELLEHGVQLPQDLHRLNQRDCDELRKRYLELACEKVPRHWDAQLVDKNPLNMMWLPLIHRLFPHAKFILALRQPCDVLLSCYLQNFRSSVLALACTSLERLATAYVIAMEHWLHHVEVLRPDVLVSRYEDLVADTAHQTQRIADFIGVEDARPMLEFDRHARNKGFIATPSYTQVVQPVNRKAIDRWLRYRREFAPVLPILEPMLRHWGYAATIPAE